MIFMLSGILSLIGGGMVNVNIQLATLKERVREVGVKMAIGASGPRDLQGVHDGGAAPDGRSARLVGLVIGVGFSKIITGLDRHPAPHRREELRLGVPARRASSASCSPSSRPGRPPASRRWRRCAMSEPALPLSRRRPADPRAPPPVPRARKLSLGWEIVKGGLVELWAHKLRSTLTLTLLMLGVFALVVMTSVLDGVMDKIATGLLGHELGRHRHARSRLRRRRPRSRSASRCARACAPRTCRA